MSTSMEGEENSADGLTGLADAILSYLREIQDCWTVCQRHEGTAVLRERHEGLEITRFFECRDQTLTHVESAIRLLAVDPRIDGDDVPDLGCYGTKQQDRGSPSSSGMRAAIVWEARTGIVDACRSLSHASLLQVTLLLLPQGIDLPELPLRTVADALRCHEFLVPEVIGVPVPPPVSFRSLTVREYLQRAMPSNLHASQCIPRTRAEQ